MSHDTVTQKAPSGDLDELLAKQQRRANRADYMREYRKRQRENAPVAERRPGDLTPKQERFANEYVRTSNATEAYRRAYNVGQSAEATINRGAHEVVTTPKVAARIKELQVPAERAAAVDFKKTFFETARIAFSDPRRLFDDEGQLRPVQTLDADMAAAIASFETRQVIEGAGENAQAVRITKVKLWDKNQALDKLMRHFGGYKEDNAQRLGAELGDLAGDILGLIRARLQQLKTPALTGPDE